MAVFKGRAQAAEQLRQDVTSTAERVSEVAQDGMVAFVLISAVALLALGLATYAVLVTREVRAGSL